MKFQLLEIREALTGDAVRAVLCNLPRDLSETYSRIIYRIHHRPGGVAKLETMRKVFQWVSGAKRPLDLAELEEAVGIEPTDQSFPANRIARHAGKRLVADCGNLVIYDEEDDTVSFAHQTVLQYLTTELPDQHLSLLATDFRPHVVDNFIGQVCLAYLSFSDFETQLAKVPERFELQRETVEELLWWGVPFSPRIRKAVAWARPWSRHAEKHAAHQRPLVVPVYVKPSKAWTRKFVLLDYVVAYWAFYTADLTMNSPSWGKFRHIALERELLFDIRPWNEPQHVVTVDHILNTLQGVSGMSVDGGWRHDHLQSMHMYSWAMAHGVSSLLTLLDPDCLTPYLHLALAGMYPGKGKGGMGPSEAFVSLFKLLLQRPHSQRPLQLGFWNGALIYWLSTQLELNFQEVIDWYHEEYERWVKPDDFSFDVFYQDAILIAAQKGDASAFERLVECRLQNCEDLLSTLACLAQGSQTSSWALLRLISLDYSDQHVSPETRLDLICALQKFLPMIRPKFEMDGQTLRHSSAIVKPLIIVATLIGDRSGHPMLVFVALEEYIDRVALDQIGLDWTKTAFGTAVACTRLRNLLSKNIDDIFKSVRAYVALARELMRAKSPNAYLYAKGHYASSGQKSPCNCHLDVLSGLFFCENDLYTNDDDQEMVCLETVSSYDTFFDCGRHVQLRAGKELTSWFLCWAITTSDDIWERVLALRMPKSDVRLFCSIGIMRAKSLLDERDQTRISQLALKYDYRVC